MKVASGLASGPHPTADLAAGAVREALQAAGLERADSVLLFLTRDYVRHAQPAIVAAARGRIDALLARIPADGPDAGGRP